MTKTAVLTAAVMFAGLALSASPKNGSIEGTVLDHDGMPFNRAVIDISRTSRGLSQPSRFLLRTDKRGHFLCSRLPPGTYSVKITAADGFVLKEVPDVSVEAGRVQNLDSSLKVAFFAPVPGEKVPRPPPTPTQPDVIRGCIAARNIVFQAAHILKLNSDVGVYASITSQCTKEAQLLIDTSFYDANGNQIASGQAQKLIQPGASIEFHGVPDSTSGAEDVRSKIGRITEVYVEFIR